MDILWFLEDRLGLVQRFYDQAAAPFLEIKRRIEDDEEPYVDTRDPEYYDEPAFLAEHQEADDCLTVLGHTCVSMLERYLHNYLRDFLRRERIELAPQPGEKGSWFVRFCRRLEEHTGFSWDRCPVERGRIEQVNLSRNDVEHSEDNSSAAVHQTEEHFERYPASRFAEEWEIEMYTKDGWYTGSGPRIRVARESLVAAIEDVRAFCRYVEAQRTPRSYL